MKMNKRTLSVIAVSIILIFIVSRVGGGEAAMAQPVSATYAYDALGRLITVTYSNGSVVTYNYDAAGNRTSVTSTGATAATWGQFTWGSTVW